jgi:hypothetical protein
MHVVSPLRRVQLGVAILVVAVLLVAVGAQASSRPIQLAGTWSGKYSGAVSGTFTLKWTETGSKLSGSITLSRPAGKYGIGGSVAGSAIHFGAVSVGAKYTGTASSTSMSGRWTSPSGGGSWSAHKVTTKKKK